MTDPSAQKQVSMMFNAISKRYDQVNRILSFGIDQKWRKKLSEHLPEKKNLRLLDLATGTCDQLLSLMETEKIAEALGIDLAQEMLALGEKKVAATPYAEKVELKLASALEIPSSDSSFGASAYAAKSDTPESRTRRYGHRQCWSCRDAVSDQLAWSIAAPFPAHVGLPCAFGTG